jgi:hypothetical protein
MEAIATEPPATGLSLLQRDSRCVWVARQTSMLLFTQSSLSVSSYIKIPTPYYASSRLPHPNHARHALDPRRNLPQRIPIRSP